MFGMAQFFFCTILQEFTISVKNALSGLFFRKQKGTRVFQRQEIIKVVVISALSSTKLCLRFCKFYILAKIFGEMFIMSMKPTTYPKEP